MNMLTYARRNLFRRRGRTILTIVGVALAVLIFSGIRTVVASFEAGADAAAKDRIATRHKNSIVMLLPKRYIEDVRELPGVKAATYANWFGSKDPKKRTPFFAAFAADHETWFTVMDEMGVEPAVLEEWRTTPNGAVLGDILAKTLEVKPGDRLVIQSDIFPGDWEFKVVGIYEALRKTVDRNSMVFRWDYLNNDPRGAIMKDKIGWVLTRIDEPKESAALSKRIDATFDQRDDQTVTMSERAFQLSFLGAFASVLRAFDVVSGIILLIMALILANTIATAVRERTHEYGVLRAVGFQPHHVVAFIVGESVLIALMGGLAGVLLTAGLINGMMGPAIEENMGAMFPYFRAPMGVISLALLAAVVLGTLAAIIPAWRASRLKVTDALRRID
ncbi:MAG: ABC transporter permease [Kofleriaceae bacterium]|nr:MAG: ABC transporter permease [Kofleriaceae bacterium]MBZ0237794.1 ABC transporter permease [Kofleriaceae bacterium]